MRNRREIEELRNRVPCSTVLEASGFAIDVKESTRRAVKFRRAAEIIIVTHEGRGWFDPLSDAKGDVFSLVTALESVGFVEGVSRVAALSGYSPSSPAWRDTEGKTPQASVLDRWEQRKRPKPGSDTWCYICWTRALPDAVVRQAVQAGVLREGPFGSMWAAHTDKDGVVSGWEERGPDWRGFASGGMKILFRFGAVAPIRLCVTEAAIDAMSLAAIEGVRDGTLYVSTGGGWSPATEAALRLLLSDTGAQLVAATDANPQGESFADRLRALSDEMSSDWLRLRPPADDWNAVLQERKKENANMESGKRRAASPSTASREAAPG
ncbi:DUF3991 and toprim domain-containing protein [Rhizobium sp. AAP43]|uniref:DUF3991 and toprim domain-containing protein n=1 Tax=Rhizobium sp. AAP43 TaxID=1523420 RepID=UPI0006B9E0E5|nr:DUF3991 and toprim domain-containing protein [Rhizobium sp. AAP43]KPF42624.1 hypothetical protein IP76_16545 [Rhizobium sp. AAP43]